MSHVEPGCCATLRRLLASTALIVATCYASSASAALTISIQQMTPNPLLTRAAVDYSVTVQNAGTIVGQPNVQVRVQFPGSSWRVPANGPGTDCSFAGGGGAPTALITCMAGTLAGGATKRMAFRIMAPSRVANDRSQQFTITAGLDVNGSLAGTGGADAIAAVATEVRALPDLEPRWSGPLTVTAGDETAFTLQVRNVGDGLAVGVYARIIVPQGMGLVRLEQSTFRSCPMTGQEIMCSDLLIRPGSEASVGIIVRPAPRGFIADQDGTQVPLSVSVDPSGSVSESRETNNTAFIRPAVRSRAWLSVSGSLGFEDYPKGDIHPCGVPSRGRLMTASLRVRNLGPGTSPATTVSVDWQGINVRAVANADSDCASGSCCMAGTCVPRTQACPTRATIFFNSVPVPPLAPEAEVLVRASALGDVPGFLQHQVEWGRATLDPNNLVNDSNRLDNTWTMHP